MSVSSPQIDKVTVSAYTIPTDAPEADGTLSWDSTTLVLAEIEGGGKTGLGYTYGQKAVVPFAKHLAEKCLAHEPMFDIARLHEAMRVRTRNDGNEGIGAMAISALDVALWDLKARLLDTSVIDLLGAGQDSVAAYGSGGFTSYSDEQLTNQMRGWAEMGMKSVKMKVGTHPEDDPRRVEVARSAIGPDVDLFVDGNGAYSAKQAMLLADMFAEEGVTWFEEPVSADHLQEMQFVRGGVPAGMRIAAGEYGYNSFYFRHMLEAQAVDVLQIDGTRAHGFTGFLAAAAIGQSYGIPLSAHCAPTLHKHVACAIPGFLNIEYFHDHVRIESMLFDGFAPAVDGILKPDRGAPGLGLTFKHKDAERYAA